MAIKCQRCGKECRIGTEQVGVDVRGLPIIHRFAYCDACFIKNDLDSEDKKKESGFGIAGLVCSILTASGIFAIASLVLCLIGLTRKDKKSVCGIIGLVICFLILFANVDWFGDDNTDTNVNAVETMSEMPTGENCVEDTENQAKMEESRIEVAVTEDLVFDEKNVKIYLKAIEENSTNYLIDFQIENNSSLNLGFNAHAYSINKIMTGNNIYEMDYDVAAGKKTVAQLEIDKRLLEEMEVEKIETIDLLIWAYDNDKSFKEFDTGQIEIKTNLDDGSYKVISGENVYEKDGIKVDFVEYLDREITYCVTNETGNYLDFDVENITINDCTSSDLDFDLIGVIVLNDCQVLITIEPSDEFISLNEIEEIKKVEFDMNIRPMEDYFEDFKTDTITLEF